MLDTDSEENDKSGQASWNKYVERLSHPGATGISGSGGVSSAVGGSNNNTGNAASVGGGASATNNLNISGGTNNNSSNIVNRSNSTCDSINNTEVKLEKPDDDMVSSQKSMP